MQGRLEGKRRRCRRKSPLKCVKGDCAFLARKKRRAYMARLLRQGLTEEEASAQLSGLFVRVEGQTPRHPMIACSFRTQ